MEDEYLKKIWSSRDNETEDFLKIDDQSIELMQIRKVRHKLKSLLLPKVIGIILGLGWISFMFLLTYLCFLYTPMSLGKVFFVGSLSMILLITGFGVILYVKDIFTIRQIDISGSVTFTQRKLATLQLSVLNSVRVLWLQLPFYTTWYINYEMIMHGSIILWIIQIIITGLTVWLAIWLFININYKNLNKKWIHHFIRGYGFFRINQAIDFINEIDDFKDDQNNLK